VGRVPGSQAPVVRRLVAVRQRVPADAILLFLVLIWSFHFAVVKYLLSHGVPPFVYATLRVGVGSLLFAGIAYGHERSLRVRKGDLWLMCGVLGVCLYVNQAGFAYAVDLTSASTVALLFGTLPICIGLIGWATGIERARWRQWLAAAVSFSGVALIAVGAGGGISADLGGALLGLLVVATWAAYSVLVTPLLSRYSPFKVSAVAGLAATVPLVPTAAPQLTDADWSDVTTLAWLGVAYTILFTYVLGNVLWFNAIGRVGANRASLYANLQPFLGAAFAVVTLGETMGALQLIGGAVIAAGILLARERRPAASID
jgi:drug/metabolite transporter (DMT)-like permease